MTAVADTTASASRSVKPARPDGKRRNILLLMLAALRLAVQAVAAAIFVAALRTPKSMRRYLLGAAATTMVIWGVAGAYLFLSKPSFTSRWTLILPTAASNATLHVDSIGNAQTSSSSPFGSATSSPKVIYKEIISSEQVRLSAAQSLSMPLPQFGSARVKLIDETLLMLFEINGPTALLAQQKANALIAAFHRQLDSLRRDEIQRRAEVVEDSLKSYQTNLASARDRILEQQQRTGVLSLNQYNEASTGLELMRRRLSDVRAEVGRLAAEQSLLSREVGINVKLAAALMRVAADPSFGKISGELADSVALYNQDAARFGHRNPFLELTRARAAAAREEMRKLLAKAGITEEEDLEKALPVMNGTHRAELIKSLVASDAAIAGKRDELATLEADFRQRSEDLKQMSASAARLEDLRKDHLVAEAVFTSALARLDTNKVDIYSSYPMVQTLAAPDLPEKKSSPSALIAIIGGAAGSFLSIAGWGLAWLRFMFMSRPKMAKPDKSKRPDPADPMTFGQPALQV